MPQPVDLEGLTAEDMEFRLLTEQLCFRERVGSRMSSFNPLCEPLDDEPWKGWLTPRVIFHDELALWREQSPQSCKCLRWPTKVMQCIGAGNQVKGVRWIGKSCCLTFVKFRVL